MSGEFVVALMGPDGAGKSTLADAVERALEGRGLAVRRQHWRPGRLPGGRRERTPDQVQGIRNTPSRGALESAVMMLYYVADFWLGRLARPRGSGVLLAERWYYDILLDPARYRLRALRPLARLLARAAPAPDLCVCLTGSPEAMAERKGELTEEEVRNQLGRIDGVMRLVGGVPVLRVSTTDATPADSVAVIVREIEAMTDRPGP